MALSAAAIFLDVMYLSWAGLALTGMSACCIHGLNAGARCSTLNLQGVNFKGSQGSKGVIAVRELLPKGSKLRELLPKGSKLRELLPKGSKFQRELLP